MTNDQDSSPDLSSPQKREDQQLMTTTAEAARLLGYASTKGISQRIQRGRIPGAMKQGGTWLVPVSWVREQQEQQKAHPAGMKTEERSSPARSSPPEEGVVPHPCADEPSSPMTPNPDPVLPPIEPGKGVDSPKLARGVVPVASAQARYDQSLNALKDKTAQLAKERTAIADSLPPHLYGYDLMQVLMDEGCSVYKCYCTDGCLYYRTKGCPCYDESSRDSLKYALSISYLEKHNIPHSMLAPCFAMNF